MSKPQAIYFLHRGDFVPLCSKWTDKMKAEKSKKYWLKRNALEVTA